LAVVLTWTRQTPMCICAHSHPFDCNCAHQARGVTPATTHCGARARAITASRACPRQNIFCHELERPAKFQAQQLPRGACGRKQGVTLGRRETAVARQNGGVRQGFRARMGHKTCQAPNARNHAPGWPLVAAASLRNRVCDGWCVRSAHCGARAVLRARKGAATL
jgi:hypothetical protein